MMLRIHDLIIVPKEKSLGIPITKHSWLWIPYKLIKTDHYQRLPNFSDYNIDAKYIMSLQFKKCNHRMSIWIDFEVEDKWFDFEFEKGKTNRERINELDFIEIL